MKQLTFSDMEYFNRRKKTSVKNSFMHIDFNEQQVPNATTLLKFRHMLEANKLGEKIFADVTEMVLRIFRLP